MLGCEHEVYFLSERFTTNVGWRAGSVFWSKHPFHKYTKFDEESFYFSGIPKYSFTVIPEEENISQTLGVFQQFKSFHLERRTNGQFKVLQAKV